jgi:hypothetical protein
VILIVWDTRSDGHDLLYWTEGREGGGWTDRVDEAIDYATRPAPRDEADRDLPAARETVQRGVQRGRVDVQEILSAVDVAVRVGAPWHYDPNTGGPNPDPNPEASADDRELFGGAVWEEIPGERDMRVRRLVVPGGWLYQVEHHQRMEPIAAESGHWIYGWHAPVFVPAPCPAAVRR